MRSRSQMSLVTAEFCDLIALLTIVKAYAERSAYSVLVLLVTWPWPEQLILDCQANDSALYGHRKSTSLFTYISHSDKNNT